MEKYSFFDAILGSDGAYDRVYSSADVASYFASFVDNGVYAEPARSLMVVEKNASSTIHVEAGKGWINGYFYELDKAGKDISVPLGDSLHPRIDTVVLALDLTKRLMEIELIQGTPSATPSPKKPVRTATRYELILGEVRVEAGSSKIQQSNITDTRMDKSKCGIVAGVINQIDTSKLFAQYDSEFNQWFAGIQGTLEGDVAANLTSQMASVNKKVGELDTKVSGFPTIRHGADAPANSLGVDGDIYFQILAW